MEILIVQTAFPGDLFLSLPLLKQARIFFPNARIHLMCRKNLGEFFLKENIVDSVIEIQKGDRSSYQSALSELNSKNLDYVICPHRSVRTALFLSRLKAEIKVGYRLWWNRAFFHRRLSYNTELPDALRQLELLTLISPEFLEIWRSYEFKEDFRGSKDVPILDFSKIEIPQWMRAEVSKNDSSSKTICVAPGSVWATKKWKTKSFSEVVRRLLDHGFKVELIGAQADLADCELIAAENPRAINTCGETTLYDLFKHLKSARLLISNDSGAMHVASAAGTPTLAIFGPTVPEFGYRPWNQNSKIIQAQLPWRPCSRHGTRACTKGTHACMENISADLVFNEALKMLATPLQNPSH